MQNFIQQKPYRFAIQNDKNDLLDSDAILQFPARAHTEQFEGGAPKLAEGTIILGGPEACRSEKILRYCIPIYTILVFSGTNFKVIFV